MSKRECHPIRHRICWRILLVILLALGIVGFDQVTYANSHHVLSSLPCGLSADFNTNLPNMAYIAQVQTAQMSSEDNTMVGIHKQVDVSIGNVQQACGVNIDLRSEGAQKQNGVSPIPIKSTEVMPPPVRIMVAYVLLEQMSGPGALQAPVAVPEKVDAPVVPSSVLDARKRNSTHLEKYDQDQTNIREGEVYTVESLIHCILICNTPNALVATKTLVYTLQREPGWFHGILNKLKTDPIDQETWQQFIGEMKTQTQEFFMSATIYGFDQHSKIPTVSTTAYDVRQLLNRSMQSPAFEALFQMSGNRWKMIVTENTKYPDLYQGYSTVSSDGQHGRVLRWPGSDLIGHTTAMKFVSLITNKLARKLPGSRVKLAVVDPDYPQMLVFYAIPNQPIGCSTPTSSFVLIGMVQAANGQGLKYAQDLLNYAR